MIKTKYKMGQEVFYKREFADANSICYTIRSGTVSYIQVSSSFTVPKYRVDTMGYGVGFLLPENEVYLTQEEAVGSIK